MSIESERAKGYKAGYTAAVIDTQIARKRKPSKLLIPLLLYNTAVGMASTLLFVLVFYTEAFKGHGIAFIEPNIAVATGEFFAAIAGIISMATFYWKYISERR
jgi:hypothetical protein